MSSADLFHLVFDTVDGEHFGSAAGHFQCDARPVFTDADHDITHALHGANLSVLLEALVQDAKEIGDICK